MGYQTGKKELSDEKIKAFIESMKGSVERLSWAFVRYDKISKKYGIDLAEWIDKNKDDLDPKDHGLHVVKMIKRIKEKKGKINFYEGLLKERATKKHALVNAYPSVFRVGRVNPPD